MKIAGYVYDYTTTNTGIPSVPNERVNEELSGIGCEVSTEGREVYHGSGRRGSGINDGHLKFSGKMSMTMELLSDIIDSPYFVDGLDMAPPFDMSITCKANIAPYTSIEILVLGVRLELPSFDWKKGDPNLPIDVNYKCLDRTKDGKQF